jgi:hypothetical protein
MHLRPEKKFGRDKGVAYDKAIAAAGRPDLPKMPRWEMGSRRYILSLGDDDFWTRNITSRERYELYYVGPKPR